jgi:hypothetical protein
VILTNQQRNPHLQEVELGDVGKVFSPTSQRIYEGRTEAAARFIQIRPEYWDLCSDLRETEKCADFLAETKIVENRNPVRRRAPMRRCRKERN